MLHGSHVDFVLFVPPDAGGQFRHPRGPLSVAATARGRMGDVRMVSQALHRQVRRIRVPHGDWSPRCEAARTAPTVSAATAYRRNAQPRGTAMRARSRSRLKAAFSAQRSAFSPTLTRSGGRRHPLHPAAPRTRKARHEHGRRSQSPCVLSPIPTLRRIRLPGEVNPSCSQPVRRTGSETRKNIPAVLLEVIAPGVSDQPGAAGPTASTQHSPLGSKPGLGVFFIGIGHEARIGAEIGCRPLPHVA